MTYSFFKSRTNWTVFAMFVIGGGNAIVQLLPPVGQTVALALLGALAMYFHINPSQQYNQPGITG